MRSAAEPGCGPLRTGQKIPLERELTTENDRLMYNYVINSNKPCIIISNKADKIAVTKVDAQVKALQNELNPLKDFTFFPYSSERRIYSDNIWTEIKAYIDI